MLDHKLVHPVIDDKDPGCGLTLLGITFGLPLGHGPHSFAL
jgi:hypothetical protein